MAQNKFPVTITNMNSKKCLISKNVVIKGDGLWGTVGRTQSSSPDEDSDAEDKPEGFEPNCFMRCKRGNKQSFSVIL